nr:UBN2 domain-containing protein [Tanacetum cinerariifolium]
MLLDGSELTKEDRESQLYDDFEHFRQHNEESIHDYYVRFAKLINDMRNIKMTMSKLQLNSEFVNNMLPEWGRFVTAVKLNRGLRDFNYTQLFAYLKQHEAHAKENKMMLERYGEAQNRVGNANQGQARPGQARTMKCYNCNGGQDNAFDDDVDEQPVWDLALNVDNVFQAKGYDTCAYHEEHVMHDSVQLDHGVELHADYTSVSNMIPYDQYVKDNE